MAAIVLALLLGSMNVFPAMLQPAALIFCMVVMFVTVLMAMFMSVFVTMFTVFVPVLMAMFVSVFVTVFVT